MTLAQVFAIVGLILLSMVTWACILATTALLLPRQSSKAETTLEGAPVASFFGGLGMMIILLFGLVLIQVPFPPVRVLGVLLVLALAGIMTIGSAGLVRLIGKRIGLMSNEKMTFKSLFRGSLIFSFGLNVPILGWLLFSPLALIFTLGAGIAGLFPSQQVITPQVPPPYNPDYDVMGSQGVK
ncbi:MAG TPA: hypothetical protein VKT32_08950 [Chthonomonadaceae bacterium]|nr:hypothetical protein [Chthonomonadaceae bacterium]